MTTDDQFVEFLTFPVMKNSTEADAALARHNKTIFLSRCGAVRGSLASSIHWRVAARRSCGNLLQNEDYVAALGALTGNQAIQQVKAGLKAIYVSGWQVAADANLAGQMYPDQSLYPANSVPAVVRQINQALQRADQIHHAEGSTISTGSPRLWPMAKRDLVGR